MKVLVNAVSVREGGPLVALRHLLCNMANERPAIRWIIAAHPSVHLDIGEQIDVGNVQSGLGIVRWYAVGLNHAAIRHRADVIFSVTNYLPVRKAPCPTVLLEQHAGHFSKIFDRLQISQAGLLGGNVWRLKTWWVERSVRNATIVTVQTQALADAISLQTGRGRDTIDVIPHGPGIARQGEIQRSPRAGPMRIGYITKWGVQKNFGVLLRAAVRLQTSGIEFRLVLTLNESLPHNLAILQTAKELGLADVIENHGEVDASMAPLLYEKLDIFVFPSLVESFGFPMVEAMAHGIPLLVANTESNREVAGSAALIFSPDDDQELAELLTDLISNPSFLAEAAEAAARRGRDFNWKRCAEHTLKLFERAVYKSRAR